MTPTIESPVTRPSYTPEQTTAWLRGLLTLAWADGDFDTEERTLITSLIQEELAPCLDFRHPQRIAPEELAAAFGSDSNLRENFMRTAVMVALADGVYTQVEDNLLQGFGQALGLRLEVLEALRSTLVEQDPAPQAITQVLTEEHQAETPAYTSAASEFTLHSPDSQRDVLTPVRSWLDGLEIHEPQLARFLCKMIPPQCPFERDIALFGRKVVHIPPLCKLNPLYEQLVGLRFRALSYLADDCGEDVSPYC